MDKSFFLDSLHLLLILIFFTSDIIISYHGIWRMPEYLTKSL